MLIFSIQVDTATIPGDWHVEAGYVIGFSYRSQAVVYDTTPEQGHYCLQPGNPRPGQELQMGNHVNSNRKYSIRFTVRPDACGKNSPMKILTILFDIGKKIRPV